MFRRVTIILTCALVAVSAGTHAQEVRSIALILDASGSMNAKLAGGETRIEAAKAAVAAFVAKLDPHVRIAYRVYGHQSPTKDRNCNDIELMVGFGPVSANRDIILAKTKTIKAQGYTPITDAIRLAAGDVAKEAGEHVVVLVSDGKETCQGDPCVVAKALAAADAKLVIHTIGFNVDSAARYQLQCMAKMARGFYSDASGAADLGAKLGEAAVAKPAMSPAKTAVARPKPGRLQIRNPDVGGHQVTDAETGKPVGEFRGIVTNLELPAGLYNVAFGQSLWKSVEVKDGETTVLDPGVIELTFLAPAGHKILDWETGVEVGELRGVVKQRSVLPSTFTVTFGGAEWKQIEVKAGERKVLNPAVIVTKPPQGNKVYTEDGALVGTLRGVVSQLPVPPGKYTIEARGKKLPLDLKEGQRMEIDLK